jgi:uncharacterized phage protein gp47/JayE
MMAAAGTGNAPECAGRGGEAAAARQTALALATAKGDLALAASLAGVPPPRRARRTGI